jgi:hypothetical protein
MPTRAILTPFEKTAATQVGPGVWRKRVLPVGSINYKGRVLNFTPKYLQDLATSFNDQAYDQVPFQLADANNTHTNDPERYRGEILGMEVDNDGLYVRMRPNTKGGEILSDNPKLGVSARIVEQYERADGKFYPAAIQHVLGTLDPRIPNLGPWQQVEMSNSNERVYDLSDVDFDIAGEEATVPDLTANQQARLDRLLGLNDTQFEAFIATLDGTAADLPAPALDTADDLTDEELAEVMAELDDTDLEAIEAEYQSSLLVGTGAGPQSDLSNDYDYGGGVSLHEIQLAEQQRQLDIMGQKMDADAFELEKRQMVQNGVPPYIVDMAQPLLQGSGHVVELSNGQGVDAGLVMRRVMTEWGRVANLFDLGSEMGSSMDEPDTSAPAADARAELVARYRGLTGL